MEALYHVAKQMHSESTHSFASAVTFVASPNANVLAQRAYMAFQQPEHSIKKELVILAAGLLLFVTSYLVIFQPASFPSPPDVDGAIMITPETAYLVQVRPDEYELWYNGAYSSILHGDMIALPPYNSLEVKK